MTDADGRAHLSMSATVLPAGYFPSRSAVQPERRLLLAILEDALTTGRGAEPTKRRRGRSPRAEARAWVFSNDVRWPFSYVNICGVLGIDPQYLRRSLLQSEKPPTRPRSARLQSGSRTRLSLHRHIEVTQAI